MSVGFRRLPALQGLLAVAREGAASAAAVIWARAALATGLPAAGLARGSCCGERAKMRPLAVVALLLASVLGSRGEGSYPRIATLLSVPLVSWGRAVCRSTGLRRSNAEAGWVFVSVSSSVFLSSSF